MRHHPLGQAHLRANPPRVVKYMIQSALLWIARHRAYDLCLSRDRSRVVMGLNVPNWFVQAVKLNELLVIDAMRHGFLRDGKTPHQQSRAHRLSNERAPQAADSSSRKHGVALPNGLITSRPVAPPNCSRRRRRTDAPDKMAETAKEEEREGG